MFKKFPHFYVFIGNSEGVGGRCGNWTAPRNFKGKNDFHVTMSNVIFR